jgi:hypothetical protein
MHTVREELLFADTILAQARTTNPRIHNHSSVRMANA